MGSKSIKYNKSNGGLMIDYLTFIDELKKLKPVVVSLDDTVEDTDTKINKLIKKYETIMTEHEKEENNEPSRT